MGTTQKYSLKWNDFTVNVASAFRDLHSRHDFVDVTLACEDGSTLQAHKVILSSVSTYFRDILKKNPCKHPIVILKDTGHDEAAAMLEFAYTGEVHVAQDLLPALLHTARCFKIKGLDRVESPVEIPMQSHQPDSLVSATGHWADSFQRSRSRSPNSDHSPQETKIHPDYFRPTIEKIHSPTTVNNLRNLLQTLEQENDRKTRKHSPPSSYHGSQPSTREGSPGVQQQSGSFHTRTPPPKRWKRSFDTSPSQRKDARRLDQPLPLVTENSMSRDDFVAAKRFREPCPTATNGHHHPGSGPTYSQSMPTSPTMFVKENERRLAGFIHHHLSNGLSETSGRTLESRDHSPVHHHSGPSTPQQATSTTSDTPTALDYRCFSSVSKTEVNGHDLKTGLDFYKANSSNINNTTFRLDPAVTDLDMSPEETLSEPPSVRTSDINDLNRDDDLNDPLGEDLNGFNIRPDALGQYNCDECGKVFKHPGSLQHHRHIHKGTHKCPSCGKAFSRRWDMERHLNKSKYGCPANRYPGSDSANVSPSPSPIPPLASVSNASLTPAVLTATTHLDLLAAVSNRSHHSTTV